ncbi:MAG: aspartate--tRNA ligase [Planctomycetota bacterium]|jgi:aspartyl-tRNA synthetase|nr:aspartate--tRNA ligase [Planctomycetota bacterium]
MLRTHTCGELRAADAGKTVTLAGWVQNRRDHGGVMFIDLRDRYGLVQIKFDLEKADVLELGQHVRAEWVLQITGAVAARPSEMVNPKMATGEIEIGVQNFSVLSKSEVIPFETDEYGKAGEEIRLKYRFLDLRRPQMQRHLQVRHRVVKALRDSMDAQGFLEIETPVLGKPTPEGARDYLVPSRVYNGHYYALPQSPQIFKQLLMIGGCDRYYQVARCFRDEDLRADRQPEFTQLDVEMSFATQEDVFGVLEIALAAAMKAGAGVDIATPFPRLTYADALRDYGCDKPDLRFGMKLVEVTDLVQNCGFKVFSATAQSGGIIKMLVVKGVEEKYSRKDLDGLHEQIKQYGAKGLAWIKIQAGGEYNGAPVKFFSKEELDAVAARSGATTGDIMMFMADAPKVVNASLAALRNLWGKMENLTRADDFQFVWVTEFPLFEYSDEHKRWESCHHPFTMINEQDLPRFMDGTLTKDSDLGGIRSTSYDIVLNGWELASGSVRIHNSAVQAQVFRILGISEEEAKERFGFFIDALKYGTPPHAGIAPGIDRLLALILGVDNIREVVAFPKTQKAADLMTGAPATVDAKQLRDLGIKHLG